jgi:DNA-binding response OmpR family regulator
MPAIAIYEEDQLMRALLHEWLCSAGYRVQVAAPFGSALPGRVDLAIVSIYMPKQEGAHLLHRVQAAHPGTPLIALSAQFRCDLSSAGATARCLGVAQVIAKPLARGTLLDAVHAMIGPPN